MELSIQKAKTLYEIGRVTEAIALLTQLIQCTPDNMAARESLGDIYKVQEAYEKAAQQYRYIFEHRPYAVDAALKLFYVYLCQPHKSRQAYTVLRCAAHRNPHHLTVWLWYAIFCQLWMADDEDIAALVAKVESLSAGNLEKELEVAATYLASGLLEQAQAACARALNLDSQDSRVYHLLFQVYMEEGLFWLASAALRQAQVITKLRIKLYYDYIMPQRQVNSSVSSLLPASLSLTRISDPLELLLPWQQLALLQMKSKVYSDAFFTSLEGKFDK